MCGGESRFALEPWWPLRSPSVTLKGSLDPPLSMNHSTAFSSSPSLVALITLHVPCPFNLATKGSPQKCLLRCRLSLSDSNDSFRIQLPLKHKEGAPRWAGLTKPPLLATTARERKRLRGKKILNKMGVMVLCAVWLAFEVVLCGSAVSAKCGRWFCTCLDH